MCRLFTREYLWGQHLWKGGERVGLEMAWQGCPSLGQNGLNSICSTSISHWIAWGIAWPWMRKFYAAEASLKGLRAESCCIPGNYVLSKWKNKPFVECRSGWCITVTTTTNKMFIIEMKVSFFQAFFNKILQIYGTIGRILVIDISTIQILSFTFYYAAISHTYQSISLSISHQYASTKTFQMHLINYDIIICLKFYVKFA